MILLILFAFIGGVITILSPCILPILPIVLSGSLPAGTQASGEGKRKPQGIVAGFILSFTFFTLFLTAIVRSTGLSADFLRGFSIAIILIFGISLLLPQFQVLTEKLFSKLSGSLAMQKNRQGFLGGILIGLSIGLIWTPCVGPILASVITLAATSEVNLAAFLITIAYAAGTAIPMFAIMHGGRSLLLRVPWLLPNAGNIQKGFGVLMILTAIGIFFNIDRRFQTYVLETFPNYGTGLTSLEDNEFIKKQLDIFMNNDRSQKYESSKSASVSGAFPNDLKDRKIKAPEIIPGGEWFNLPAGRQAPSIEDLRGKVVLIDFWTYTCINCQRTFPYLRDWHAKYKDKGLVIIGVHSPEFEFEKNPENVKKAISDFGIEYPVIQDNNFDTWSAYSNRYWPAKYLIDKDGYIRYVHFGEGAYAETEVVIQKLLKNAGKNVLIDIKNDSSIKRRFDISPETYLGYQRMEFLMGQRNSGPGEKEFRLQDLISENTFSFGGVWEITKESAVAKDSAVIVYNFNADKVFLVMNPSAGSGQVPSEEQAGEVKVYLDDRLVDLSRAGADVVNGVVTVDSDRLYELIDLRGNPGNHLLRLEFSDGIEAFAFTFG
jgi:cytochrome c biogenesis protein CcdA/thiol-disulfide isomerase/thioredoxin